MKFLLLLLGTFTFNCYTLRFESGHSKTQTTLQKHTTYQNPDQNNFVLVSMPFFGQDDQFESQNEQNQSQSLPQYDPVLVNHFQVQSTVQKTQNTEVKGLDKQLKEEQKDEVDPHAQEILDNYQKGLELLNPSNAKITQVESQIISSWDP